MRTSALSEQYNPIDNRSKKCIFPRHAQMAELVDALASGASDRKVVEVQVLFWAPFQYFLQLNKLTFRTLLRKSQEDYSGPQA